MPAKSKEIIVNIEDKKLKLTSLDKIMFPNHITKGEVIKYYYDMAEVLLPHIRQRPLVMKRYPEGIYGDYFYQKECPAHAPEWVRTFAISHGGKKVNYVVCDNLPTLIWLVNLGCLEIHAWTSRVSSIECPDTAVMDLDPAPGTEFADVLKAAILVKQALKEFGLKSYPKTSGSRGIHLFVPIAPKHSFADVTKAMKYIAEIIEKIYPAKCTTERAVEKRGSKIYLDYLQNARGRTMAWQYSLRPKPGAPVSAPLIWEEVERGNIDPGNFNIRTIFQRLQLYGDLYAQIFNTGQNLDNILKLV
ncbi:bifunctional non-homologous end joining protein LigD [Desulfohalotomaculum tongense]|uniref:non-homologous end-joining DNA ligase n=1 Tax=Desulforadius tongensis TaxID=1216062 RepID=UPI0019568A54|nr:non-homologous end-joining DNA ligase [Desulforadius tongensis]MBM7854412.1 bifunctional non-homologous end joining protein LigD [Desulforadius tongensis]